MGGFFITKRNLIGGALAGGRQIEYGPAPRQSYPEATLR
jgi:hypothetical protein